MKTDFFSSTPFQEAAKRVVFRMDEITRREVNTFGNTWYTKHFTMGAVPHISRDFKTLLGQSSMAIAASTINGKSAEPLRLIDGYTDMAQKMFTMAHGYRIEGDELRDLYVLSKTSNDPKAVVRNITNYLWNVVERSVEGIHARIDMEIIYLLTHKFEFEFTNDNDPESPFVGKKLLYGGDQSHCGHVSDYTWTAENLSNFDPVKEISEVVASAPQVKFDRILIDRQTMMLICRSPKMKSYINDVNRPNLLLSESNVNQWMVANGLPPFEVVERKIRVQKGGETSMYEPYREGVLVFLPQNDLGTIETCLSDNEIGLTSDGVKYSHYGRVEVAEFKQGELENAAYAEITKARLTAAPSIPCIRDIYTLNTKSTSEA